MNKAKYFSRGFHHDPSGHGMGVVEVQERLCCLARQG
jgi:hypothetical protein